METRVFIFESFEDSLNKVIKLNGITHILTRTKRTFKHSNPT